MSEQINSGETSGDVALDPAQGRIDRILARAIQAPGLPLAFHADLIRAIALERARRETEHDRAAALENEHRRSLQRLRKVYVLLRLETVLTLIAGAFTAGAAADVVIPDFAAWIGVDARALGIAIVATAVLASGVVLAARRVRI